MRVVQSVLWLLLATLLVGCPGSVGVDAGDAGCAPGSDRACSCDGGGTGTQTCIGDGATSACVCTTSIDGSTDGSQSDGFDSGSTGGEFGAPCTRDDECVSNICLMVGRCSRPCAARTDCPASTNWQCLSLPGRGQICACAGVAGMEERACNGVDDNCDGVIDETSRTCDGMCVDIGRDIRNCGSCGIACGGGQICRDAACACPTDHPDICSGACVDLQTDVANCGTCRSRCPSGPGGTPSCVAGTCRLMCTPGTADCDSNATNGCEVNVSVDLANCGACGAACSFANAVGRCSAGSCILSSCSVGYDNCNGVPADGCETDTRSTVTSCGSCGRSCALANATPSCVSATCSVAACLSGFGDCDTTPANGCEIGLNTDTSNCGLCGNRCPARSGAVPTCATGTCGYRCNFGAADCDGIGSNGCETSTTSDPLNCGACGSACVTRPNATAQCASGTCAITCDPSFANCDGSSANGCEIDTRTALAHCGGCGRTCAPPNSTPTCSASNCGIGACNSGFANCNATTSDGCEVNLETDLRNCGTCGNICPGASALNTVASCTSGSCAITCATGFEDCDGMLANGCEAALTSTANCGTCGNVCASTFICSAGACVCPTGSTTCSGRCVNTGTDAMNCGTCGNVCPAAESCVAGACTAAPLNHYMFTSGAVPFVDVCTSPGAVRMLMGVDDVVGPMVAIPFSFPFFGRPYTAVRPSSNGYVLFGTTANSTDNSYYPSRAVPDATRPRPAAFILNSDLWQRSAAGVCVATLGTAPSRRFIVQTQDASICCGDMGMQHYTFEMVLNESDGTLDYVYQTTTYAGNASNYLIGAQNETATFGSTYEFRMGAPMITAPMSLHLTPVP